MNYLYDINYQLVYAIGRKVSNRFRTYICISSSLATRVCCYCFEQHSHTTQKQMKKHANFRVHLASLCKILYTALFLINCFINSICDAIANVATAELNIICRVHLYFTQISDSPAGQYLRFSHYYKFSALHTYVVECPR